MTDPTFAVVWPRSPLAVTPRRLARRLDTLDGRRIGFLWDHLFRGEEIFPAVADELRRRFPAVEVVGHEAFGNTHGPEESQIVGEIPAVIAARGVDAVVSGIGA